MKLASDLSPIKFLHPMIGRERQAIPAEHRSGAQISTALLITRTIGILLV
jgi:hypothetical protein